MISRCRRLLIRYQRHPKCDLIRTMNCGMYYLEKGRSITPWLLMNPAPEVWKNWLISGVDGTVMWSRQDNHSSECPIFLVILYCHRWILQNSGSRSKVSKMSQSIFKRPMVRIWGQKGNPFLSKFLWLSWKLFFLRVFVARKLPKDHFWNTPWFPSHPWLIKL